jgi:hypothetical protein
MCWNSDVSIFSAIMGFVCATFLYREGRKAEHNPSSTIYPTADPWHAMWVFNLACVQLFEFLIWQDVHNIMDHPGHPISMLYRHHLPEPKLDNGVLL